MALQHLTREDFLSKIVDYEKDPSGWVFLGDKPAIIDFYASWCAPCNTLMSVLEEFAAEYDGRIDIFKVDTDQEEELSAHFGISSIPTLLFIPKNSAPQVSRGAMLRNKLKDAIDNFLLKE